MYKNDQVVRRFSESFKLKILDELSTGKYSKRQLANIYGMGRSIINDWIRKYGRQDLEQMVNDSYLEVAAESLGYKNVESHSAKADFRLYVLRTPNPKEVR